MRANEVPPGARMSHVSPRVLSSRTPLPPKAGGGDVLSSAGGQARHTKWNKPVAAFVGRMCPQHHLFGAARCHAWDANGRTTALQCVRRAGARRTSQTCTLLLAALSRTTAFESPGRPLCRAPVTFRLHVVLPRLVMSLRGHGHVGRRRYPASDHPIELGLRNSTGSDRDRAFWGTEAQQLVQSFTARVQPLLGTHGINHLSVFALAPQPLLMLLGSLLTDKVPTQVFQLQREPEGWGWSSEAQSPNRFVTKPPKKRKGIPCVALALSARINPERITAVMGAAASIWTLTCENPHNDFIKTADQLGEFRTRAREILADIRAAHGDQGLVHVFPILPVSAAVDFGRVIMPKADSVLRVYDHQRDGGGFIPALDINSAGDGGAKGGAL